MQDGDEIQETSVGRETSTNNLTNTSKTLSNQKNIATEEIPEEQQVQASNAMIHAKREQEEKKNKDH